MKLDKSLEPFRAVLESLQRLLHKFDDRWVIIGGIAVGFLGRPRFTADVDAVFLLSTRDISKFIELARGENIVPRTKNAEDFARTSRVLLLKHAPTETDIDVSLGVLPFEEEMVERGVTTSFAGLSIRLPTPEDLVIMKAIAHRPDRYNRKWILVIGTGIWGLWTSVCGLATDYWQLLIIRVVACIGLGCLYPAAFSILADAFGPEKRGRAMGTISAIGMFGIVAGALAFGEVIGVSENGWRIGFIGLGLTSVLSGLIIAILVREPVRG